MSAPWAVIIAGGQGERLGNVRKADLRIGGVRLLDRVIDSLGDVQRPILVSTGANRLKLALTADCLAIPDRETSIAGPLAGLVAAVHALRDRGVTHGTLISLAVDTPFLPNTFVDRMCTALSDGAVAYAGWDDDFYPPNAAWNLAALGDLSARLSANDGPRSIKALQKAMNGTRVDWSAPGAKNPFSNLNTLSDLVELGFRAASPSGE